jgi:hypothetical protein
LNGHQVDTALTPQGLLAAVEAAAKANSR